MSSMMSLPCVLLFSTSTFMPLWCAPVRAFSTSRICAIAITQFGSLASVNSDMSNDAITCESASFSCEKNNVEPRPASARSTPTVSSASARPRHGLPCRFQMMTAWIGM